MLFRSLNLPIDAKIILFVGRMNELKNPLFVVDILAKLLETTNNIHAVFVGKGGLEVAVEQKAKNIGIYDNVHLLGWRNDIPSIMTQCNLFVFPRLEYPKEGLGLVIVEAQATGLPILVSNGVVDDAFVIKDLVNKIPLKDNVQEWAILADRILLEERMNPILAAQLMNQSEFSLENGTKNFVKLYDNL